MKNTKRIGLNSGLTYQKNADGNFYPVFTETPLSDGNLGKYGTLMRNYLRDFQPERFQKLQMDGTLWNFLKETDNRCRSQYEQLVLQLQKEASQQPQNGDYLAAIQMSFQIETQADEIIRRELFPDTNN